MKRALIASLMFLAMLTGVAYAGPDIEFEQLRHDFGHVKHGEILTYEFRFTNRGDEDLIIEKVAPS
jgi:hypothetical protein